jgi:transposase-like protein
VHLIRNSLAFVSWKDRKAILPAIKAIYRAEDADMALVRLQEFEAEWGKRYPGDRPSLAPSGSTSFRGKQDNRWHHQ